MKNIKYKKRHTKKNINEPQNLSSVKYDIGEKSILKNNYPLEYSKPFDIKNLLPCFSLFKINKRKNNIIINKDILKLSKYFGHELKNIDNLTEYIKNNNLIYMYDKKQNKQNDTDIFDHMYDEIGEVKSDIDNFLLERYFLFSGKRLPKELKEKFTNDLNQNINIEDVLPIIINLINISPAISLTETDFFNERFSTKKSTKTFSIPRIHNYTTLRKELYNLIENKTEFFVSCEEINQLEEKLNSLEVLNKITENDTITKNKYSCEIKFCKQDIENVQKSIDFLNTSSTFNQEFLKMLYIKLEPYVEKEQILIRFVDKILYNETL